MIKAGLNEVNRDSQSAAVLTADTPIQLATGEIVTVKKIHKLKQDNQPVELIGINPETFEHGVVEVKDVSPCDVEKMIVFTTRKGRSIALTPEHPVMVFDGENIVYRQVKELEEGDALVVPRRITFPKLTQQLFDIYSIDEPLYSVDRKTYKVFCKVMEKAAARYGNRTEVAKHLGYSPVTVASYWQGRKNLSLKFLKELGELVGKTIPVGKVRGRSGHAVTIPRKMTSELANFLGLLLADGMMKGKKCIYFYNNDDGLRARFSELAKQLFGVKTQKTWESTVWAESFCSVAVHGFLEILGFPVKKKSRNNYIPKILLKSSNTDLLTFFNAYLAGDGGFSGQEAEIGTSSEKMAIGLAYILSRCGILYRYSKRFVKGAYRYRIVITGKEINLLVEELYKVENLDEYAKTVLMQDYANNDIHNQVNFDRLPVSPTFFEEIAYTDLTEKVGAHRQHIINDNQRLSVYNIQLFIEDLERNPRYAAKVERLKYYQTLMEAFYIDPVKVVTTIKPESDTFQVRALGNKQFIVGANPLLI
ncbi:MAG: LAGLIDADG family homing endonuclease [Candidatus Hodarchaeales archaeon]|jgi:intein/homing endonuclease